MNYETVLQSTSIKILQKFCKDVKISYSGKKKEDLIKLIVKWREAPNIKLHDILSFENCFQLTIKKLDDYSTLAPSDFYERKETIEKHRIQNDPNSKKLHTSLMNFQLTERHLTMLKTNKSFLIVLMFGDCSGDATMPLSLKVILNDLNVQLPLADLGNDKGGVYRVAKPVELINVKKENFLEITWRATKDNHTYSVWVDFVRYCSNGELRNHIVQKRVTTVKEAHERFKIKDDDDISTKEITTSILCPITMEVMKYPVRGVNCKHLQCFDCEAYISTNFIRATWKCPICNRTTRLSDLYFCQFIKSICEKMKNRKETIIQFDNQLNWKSKDNVEEIICPDDSDEENDENEIPTPLPGMNIVQTNNINKTDEIDSDIEFIVLSSDDEEEKKKKNDDNDDDEIRKKEKEKNKKKEKNENKNKEKNENSGKQQKQSKTRELEKTLTESAPDCSIGMSKKILEITKNTPTDRQINVIKSKKKLKLISNEKNGNEKMKKNLTGSSSMIKSSNIPESSTPHKPLNIPLLYSPSQKSPANKDRSNNPESSMIERPSKISELSTINKPSNISELSTINKPSNISESSTINKSSNISESSTINKSSNVTNSPSVQSSINAPVVHVVPALSFGPQFRYRPAHPTPSPNNDKNDIHETRREKTYGNDRHHIDRRERRDDNRYRDKDYRLRSPNYSDRRHNGRNYDDPKSNYHKDDPKSYNYKDDSRNKDYHKDDSRNKDYYRDDHRNKDYHKDDPRNKDYHKDDHRNKDSHHEDDNRHRTKRIRSNETERQTKKTCRWPNPSDDREEEQNSKKPNPSLSPTSHSINNKRTENTIQSSHPKTSTKTDYEEQLAALPRLLPKPPSNIMMYGNRPFHQPIDPRMNQYMGYMRGNHNLQTNIPSHLIPFPPPLIQRPNLLTKPLLMNDVPPNNFQINSRPITGPIQPSISHVISMPPNHEERKNKTSQFDMESQSKRVVNNPNETINCFKLIHQKNHRNNMYKLL
ncbi:hypothetical protein SNEBB_007638 [Seison nebaliae]|nr:hypothetical protein SNEBB_007638 [Seison nebaliae]